MRIRFLIVAALLVGSAVLAMVAHLAIREASTGPLRGRVEQGLTRALGVDVTLGALDASLWPTPRLEATKVLVASPPGSHSPRLLGVERVELGVALWPLLRRTVVIDALSVEGADLHLEAKVVDWLTGRFGKRAKGVVPGDARSGPMLELHRLEVEELRVFYRDGPSGAIRSGVVDAVEVEAKDLDSEVSISAEGRFEGSEVALSGRIGSLRELMEPTQPFPVDLSGRLFEARFEVTGSVREPGTLGGLALEIAAEIPEIEVQGRPLPELGAIRFAGRVSNREGPLGLEQLEIGDASGGPVRIDVKGRIGDLLELRGVDVEGRVETGSLAFIEPFVKERLPIPMPAIAKLALQGKLSDRDGRLRFDGTLDASTPGDAISVRATGGVANPTGDDAIDVSLDLQAKDLASITALFPEIPAHEPLGAVTAKARLEGQRGVLGAQGISVRLGEPPAGSPGPDAPQKVWAAVDGSIDDVIDLRGVALEVTFGASSLHYLKEVLARELPRTTPFEGAVRVSDADGSLGVEQLRLHGGKDSPVEIHLDARFDDLPARDEIEIELGLRGQDTRVLGALAGLDLPVIAPVEFRGRIAGSDEHLEMEGATIRLGETRFAGSGSGSFASGARPSVEAQLASRDVRLQDLGIRPSPSGVGAGSDAGSGGTGPATPRSGSGSARLPFDRLRAVDLELRLELDHVGGAHGFDVRDVRLTATLEDGDLAVTDLGATYQDGTLKGALRADARTPVPTLEASIDTVGMNLEKLVSQFRERSDYTGFVDGELRLRAQGGTLEALRSSLGGRVGVAIRGGDAAFRIAREFVVNLAAALFPGLRTPKVPTIGCAVAHLDIADGIATVHTLFLREKDISVSGTGRIDLVQGLYDLRMVPTTTDPGIVSVAPEVTVTGPLDAPRFHPVKRTLLTSFGRGLFQNVVKMGGLLVRPLVRRPAPVEAHEKECRLGEIAPSIAAPP